VVGKKSMSLPNLSSLCIATQALEDGVEKPAKLARTYTSKQKLIDVDWREKFNESNRTKLQFKVFKRQASDLPMEATFELRNSNVILSGDGVNCVQITFDSYDELLELDLLFLFRYTQQEKRGTCKVSPKLPSAGSGGYGSMVLNMLDCIAYKLPATLKLEDASMFTKDQTPRVHASGLTETLCLTRGYGFYEARGWFSERSYLSLPTVEQVGLYKRMELVKLAQTADLKWTHMITTTPVNKLYASIIAFAYDIIINLLGTDEVIEKFGEGDLIHITNLYSENNCEQHAKRAKQKFIDPFLGFLQTQDANPYTRQLDETSFSALSLRQIAETKIHQADLTRWMASAFENVWTRFEYIYSIKKGIWGRRDLWNYPGSLLTKSLFKIDGTLYAFVCKPNDSLGPDILPFVVLEPVRTDLEVQFF
jgi:hypothetical protein